MLQLLFAGIPENPELAETYYEQFNDFRPDEDDNEVLDMMTNLQSVLDIEHTCMQILVLCYWMLDI